MTQQNYSDDVIRLNPDLQISDNVSRSKYHARPVTVDGEHFHSGAECNRYQMLRLQERAGDIRDLKRQVRYSLDVNGVHVCDYVADYEYNLVSTGAHIVEDCKGFRTPAYRLKRKLMLAIYGITILETDRDGVPFT